MSRIAILNALARGPKTAAQLAEIVGLHSGVIAARVSPLIHDGRVKRVDGGEGRGSIAVYALNKWNGGKVSAGRTVPVGKLPHPKSTEPRPRPPGVIVMRDPCPRCGVRGDLGCRHQARAEPWGAL